MLWVLSPRRFFEQTKHTLKRTGNQIFPNLRSNLVNLDLELSFVLFAMIPTLSFTHFNKLLVGLANRSQNANGL